MKNAALVAALFIQCASGRLVLQPGIILARQGPWARKRGRVATECRVVEYARRAVVGQNRIIVITALAGECFRARVEVGTLLNDNARSRLAIFIAAHLNLVVTVGDDGF